MLIHDFKINRKYRIAYFIVTLTIVLRATIRLVYIYITHLSISFVLAGRLVGSFSNINLFIRYL